MKPLGKKIWVIAEGYIPAYGTGPEPEFTSHETACILNMGDEDAEIRITLYFRIKNPQDLTSLRLALVEPFTYDLTILMTLNRFRRPPTTVRS